MGPIEVYAFFLMGFFTVSIPGRSSEILVMISTGTAKLWP